MIMPSHQHKLPLRHYMSELLPPDCGAAGPELARLQASLITGSTMEGELSRTPWWRLASPIWALASKGRVRVATVFVVALSLWTTAYVDSDLKVASPARVLPSYATPDDDRLAAAMGIGELSGISFP